MKKINVLLLLFISFSTVYGQSTEYSLHVNSGLFSFGGDNAVENSFIIISDVANISNYTNNPYGSKKAFSYGLAAQIERVTGSQFMFGFQAGYEVLRSNVHIKGVSGSFPDPPPSASGHTILKSKFITLYPHLGHRFMLQKLDIDLTAGPEFGFNQSSREKGEATTEKSNAIKTDRKRHNPGTDIRLRASLTVYYKHIGISAGYSYGLTNYGHGVVGGSPRQYSRFIRFGIAYRL